jgi:hypothetical protein
MGMRYLSAFKNCSDYFFFRFLRTIGTQYLAEMKAGKERKQRELSKLEEVTKNSGQTRGPTVHNWYGMCVVQVVR